MPWASVHIPLMAGNATGITSNRYCESTPDVSCLKRSSQVTPQPTRPLALTDEILVPKIDQK